MAANVRSLAPHEGELLCRVRLRALADSPESFATPLADEASLPASEWAARAAAPDQAVFVALAADGEPLGMAGARAHPEDERAIALWGMWVAPAARGSGLGRELVDAVADWALRAGAERLRLGVMTDVPASIRFYERLGFARIEERVFARDATRSWYLMTRPL